VNIDGPETTEILIFAQYDPDPFASSRPFPITLQVARITPAPPPPNAYSRVRPPRPDDPTPREPSLLFANTSHKRPLLQVHGGNKRAKKSSVGDGVGGSGAREAMLKIPHAYGPKKTNSGKDGSFVVPPLPSRKGKEKAIDDPFQVDTAVNEVEKTNRLVGFPAFVFIYLSHIHHGADNQEVGRSVPLVLRSNQRPRGVPGYFRLCLSRGYVCFGTFSLLLYSRSY